MHSLRTVRLLTPRLAFKKILQRGITRTSLSHNRNPPEDYFPQDYECTSFTEIPKFVPKRVFRPLSSPDEQLGPGANENGEYKNAKYFAYHKFSFNELQTHTMKKMQELREKAEAGEAEEEESSKKDDKESKKNENAKDGKDSKDDNEKTNNKEIESKCEDGGN